MDRGPGGLGETSGFQPLFWRSFSHSMATFFVDKAQPAFLATTVLPGTRYGTNPTRS